MSQFSATMPNPNGPTRDPYNADRAFGRTTPSIMPATPKGPGAIKMASPAGIGDEEEGGPPAPTVDQTNRRIGLQNDLQNQAGYTAVGQFNTHWTGQTKDLDHNNNKSVEDFANKYGVQRGRVGMNIDTGTNDAGGPGTGNGVRATGEWHTMNNEELLAAAKSRAREQFNAQLKQGAASDAPKSPAAYIAPQGPTAAGPPIGSQSPAGPSAADLQQYNDTQAGLTPGTAAIVARRTGMQPYDVQNEQTQTLANRSLAQAIPGQMAAQQGQMAAQQGTERAKAALDNAKAAGSISPDDYRKQIDELNAKHQTELMTVHSKVGELQGTIDYLKQKPAATPATGLTPQQIATHEGMLATNAVYQGLSPQEQDQARKLMGLPPRAGNPSAGPTPQPTPQPGNPAASQPAPTGGGTAGTPAPSSPPAPASPAGTQPAAQAPLGTQLSPDDAQKVASGLSPQESQTLLLTFARKMGLSPKHPDVIRAAAEYAPQYLSTLQQARQQATKY